MLSLPHLPTSSLFGGQTYNPALCALAAAWPLWRRELLVAEWLKFMRARGVPMSPDLADPLKLLVDDATVAGWVREGLPADPTSVQNGAILTSSGGLGRGQARGGVMVRDRGSICAVCC